MGVGYCMAGNIWELRWPWTDAAYYGGKQPEDYRDPEATNYGGKQLGKCAARNLNITKWRDFHLVSVHEWCYWQSFQLFHVTLLSKKGEYNRNIFMLASLRVLIVLSLKLFRPFCSACVRISGLFGLDMGILARPLLGKIRNMAPPDSLEMPQKHTIEGRLGIKQWS